MRTPRNALVKVMMLATWADYAKGEAVQFDEVRARWLIEQGLAEPLLVSGPTSFVVGETVEERVSATPKPRLVSRRSR